MDIDEDDDFYAPEEPVFATPNAPSGHVLSVSTGTNAAGADGNHDEDLEEGEEEEPDVLSSPVSLTSSTSSCFPNKKLDISAKLMVCSIA